MPRRLHSPPKYRRHRASGQAVVTLLGQDVYLGPYGTKASRTAYDRVVAEWLAAGRQLPTSLIDRDGLIIDELIARYWQHVKAYYLVDGKPTGEPERIRQVLKAVSKLYGDQLVASFGPLALKAVRQSWIDADLARRHINQRTGRVKRMFKWGVAEELVPASVFQALATVEGLRYGHTTARETAPIKPVPDAWIAAVLPHVTPTVAAMIQLQRLTGMRAGEVCQMRTIDIDMRGPIWLYEPASHKNTWRDHSRIISLGPRAQAIVRPYLSTKLEDFLFQPKRAVAERSAAKRKQRKSPVQPSQLDRRKKNPRKQPGDRYDTRTYARAIAYGIKKAGCPHWHSHQLRHSHATEVRRKFGIEGAQAALGHARMNVTEVYAQKNLDFALRIAAELG